MIVKAAGSQLVRNALAALLALSFFALAGSMYAIVNTQSKIATLASVDNARERFTSLLKDMETSYRGYVITGGEDFLDPYFQSKQDIGNAALELEAATEAAHLGEQYASQLTSESVAVVEYSQKLIAARKRSFDEAQRIVQQRVGKEIMDAARENSDVLRGRVASEVSKLNSRVSTIFTPVAATSSLVLLLSLALFAVLFTKSRHISVRSRQLLSEVMERAPVGVALLDSEHRVALMNATFARMAGAKKSGAGLKLSDIAPALGGSLDQKLNQALTSDHQVTDLNADSIFDVERDGLTQTFKADAFPLRMTDNEGRDMPGVGIVLTDMTQQRQWENELQDAKDEAEAANRAKSAFIANMSHELRTPLTAVLGYCELIEEDLRDIGQDAILADLNKININARHLLGLINDVLDLSKIEAQKMDVHAADIDLDKLLSDLQAATGSLVSKKENRLKVTVNTPDQRLHTDDLKIKQILLNLIGNASKFTERGEIALSVTSVDIAGIPCSQFEVSDTGIGMSAEQVSGLFQRFSQADQTTTRKYGGTGLGLALTRALATMLGGTIDVKSEVGVGSTFTLTIPTHYTAPQQAIETIDVASTDTVTASPSAKRGLSVLVVDDEASARELLSRHLTREGFDVQTAVNGTEALAKIMARRPFAVLLDVLMPGLDGWHVLKAIRSNPETADLPVIMQTVLDDDTFAYAIGATSFLKKPVKRSDLINVLDPFARSAATHDSVLVVDDDRDACDRLKVMLERDKWNVRLAYNGIEGLAAMKVQRPDLVLVDIMMPEMDGHSFIREVRNQTAYDTVPIVVLTAADVRSKNIRRLENETSAIVQKGSLPLTGLIADLRRIADIGTPETK